ncbi:MAG: hypothetical protein HQM16_12065 [Deltaproteobacteria bacterium]|nr:hypothetical protein [Deltaproteobacteria bacterium]
MKKIIFVVFCFAMLFAGLFYFSQNNPAQSEPSCTGPYRQPNGCDHYVCVGDDGKTFCQECCSNSACSVISCN